ncbi:MAG: GntR family transcriptional regulator [Muribaculaceae bacterium]|nr:GntR family transcriptional regulator [Muribaculaceae bacterium]
MINIGKYNTLKVSRVVDFGVYLDAGKGVEILLPGKYVTKPLEPGDEIEVFVYTDSEDRLIATTEHPYVTVGEFAYLEVVDVNRVGAFLDWGLTAKNLLVPFREQKATMRKGGRYLIYCYLDHTTYRIAATSKFHKYVGNVPTDVHSGQPVDCLVIGTEELGYKVIVNNLFYGMIYYNETYTELKPGDRLTALVKSVRRDGKIDLVAGDLSQNRTETLSERLVEYMKSNGGSMTVTDKTPAPVISDIFHCSKKDFKKAVGHLYKQHIISVTPEKISLND